MRIIAVAQNQWSGQWMNRQHMAWALSRFVNVLYVQEPECWSRSRLRCDEPLFSCNTESIHERLEVLRLPKCLARRRKSGFWDSRTFSRKPSRFGTPTAFYLWHLDLYWIKTPYETVIFCQGRTGSSLLANLLASHPRIDRAREVLRRRRRKWNLFLYVNARSSLAEKEIWVVR